MDNAQVVVSAAFREEVSTTYSKQEPLMNINNAVVSPPPLVVEQAVDEAYRPTNCNRDISIWSKLDAALPETKAAPVRLIDCAPTEIALNRNSSDGLSTETFRVSGCTRRSRATSVGHSASLPSMALI
ncbi:hypothetical protein [Chelativorans salis]|uniref:Uncharacterized protein n=1 Tax=Chelativorans salis TaxID=2978478 RepID=A0ABT2LUB1_9HYPH|nr:hypothetical protein [Chelativorans sp. EGI FJ00035]MCT7378120.1 hypothetical protein [Chelativorans sp. EGI FJ00035]